MNTLSFGKVVIQSADICSKYKKPFYASHNCVLPKVNGSGGPCKGDSGGKDIFLQTKIVQQG